MAIAGAFSSATYFALRKRAIDFAQWRYPNLLCSVLRLRPAEADDVALLGTPGSNCYAEVDLRQEYTAPFVEARLQDADSLPSQYIEELEQFLVGGHFHLRIVCTPTDVLRHEVLNADLGCGEPRRVRLQGMRLPEGASDDAAICQRALAYANRDRRFTNLEIVQFLPVDLDEIKQFGTAGSDRYGEVIISRRYSSTYCESMLAMEAKEKRLNFKVFECFLSKSTYLRVIGTSNNIVFHEDVTVVEDEQ